MPRSVDLTGQRFGRLLVLALDGRPTRGKAVWRCRCDCGNICTILGYNFANGHTKSCGCFRREIPTMTKRTHGMSKSKLYGVYRAMLERCYYEKADSYPRYGGRGIRVCKQWRESPSTFLSWALANGYEEGKSLERTKNNGHYSPRNCDWVDAITQANNKSNNRILTLNGRSMSLSAWARDIGVTDSALRRRLKVYKWTIKRALTTPARASI